MPLVLDTYNVLHVTGVLPEDLAGIEVPGLIDLIGRSRYAADHVLLVCDGTARGKPPAGRRGGIEIRYAGPGRTADEAIGALVARSTAPRRLVVVTSDRAVARAARKRRCRILSSQEFLRQLALDVEDQAPTAGPGRPREPLPRDEVDRWLEEMGLDPDDPSIFEVAIEEPDPPPTAEDTPPPPREVQGESVLPRRLLDEAEELWGRDTNEE